MAQTVRHSFDFGRNWGAFSRQHASPARLHAARRSLQQLLGQERLDGKRVLDVGCGSGLFALAARSLGAAQVTGVDVNPLCLAVSRDNEARLLPHSGVQWCCASALDAGAMRTLGQAEVVYAWGSLHHTGDMWRAIRIVQQNVAPGGTLVLALYNSHWSSPAWRWIKRGYNVLPRLLQRPVALLFALVIFIAKALVTRRNPLEKERGMSFWYDVVDWVGGYPYEHATPAQVQARLATAGFHLQHLQPALVPTGCNEFVFVREGEA